MKHVWMLFFTLLAFGTLSLSAQQQPTAEQVSCTPSPTCKPSPECKPSPTCPPISCCLATTATAENQAPSCSLTGKVDLTKKGAEIPSRNLKLTLQKVKKPEAIILPSKGAVSTR